MDDKMMIYRLEDRTEFFFLGHVVVFPWNGSRYFLRSHDDGVVVVGVPCGREMALINGRVHVAIRTILDITEFETIEIVPVEVGELLLFTLNKKVIIESLSAVMDIFKEKDDLMQNTRFPSGRTFMFHYENGGGFLASQGVNGEITLPWACLRNIPHLSAKFSKDSRRAIIINNGREYAKISADDPESVKDVVYFEGSSGARGDVAFIQAEVGRSLIILINGVLIDFLSVVSKIDAC